MDSTKNSAGPKRDPCRTPPALIRTHEGQRFAQCLFAHFAARAPAENKSVYTFKYAHSHNVTCNYTAHHQCVRKYRQRHRRL